MNSEDSIEITDDEIHNTLPRKPKKSVSKIFLALVTALILAAMSVWAGLKWTSQINEYKVNHESANKKIAGLEKQLSDLQTDSATTKDGYLEISQWGIKIVPTSSPMSYKIKSIDSETKVAMLSNAESDKLSEDEGCTANGVTDTQYRAIVQQEKTQLTKEEIIGNITYIGKIQGYYYYADRGNGPCSDNIEKEGRVLNDLFESAKSAVQI
ncbi:hypothetical protein KBD20_02485 [Candidatus Saccharibacteria bacterium]|nr:hypothetical protein [Candidatus Saccharibacteria bacterium]